MPSPKTRQDRRSPVRLLVSYEYGSENFSQTLRTLGEGGAFVETPTPLKEGEEIRLRLVLPSFRETLEVRGKVVWRRPFPAGEEPAGMGIRFLDPPPHLSDRIALFLSRQRDTGAD